MSPKTARKLLGLIGVIYLAAAALVYYLASAPSAGLPTLLLYVPAAVYVSTGALLVGGSFLTRRLFPAVFGLIGMALSAPTWGYVSARREPPAAVTIGVERPGAVNAYGKRPGAAGERLVAVTANVNSWGTDHEEMGRFLADQKADVLFLQEAWWAAHLEAMEQHLQGYHRIQGGQSGDLAILARFPIRFVPVNRESFRGLLVLGETDFGPVHLVNLHYRKGKKPRRGKGGKKGFRLPSPTLTLALQDEDSAAAVELVEQLDGPVVLAGDLNAPPASPFVRRLEGVLDDSFAHAGAGFGYTFPAAMPLWRIDYLWHSGEFEATQAQTVPNASDHRALRVTLLVHAPSEK
ncbi:MAG: endonuclease/exonuclease/phosphatase family protein [Armatimonadetes bacterium]|nr:endonuclease/exonuclease/phosphatase family protein [Armatimonadota bacterium]